MSESPRERMRRLVAALVGAFDYGEVADQIEAEAALMAEVEALILAKDAAEVRAVMWEEGAKELRRRLDTVRGEP